MADIQGKILSKYGIDIVQEEFVKWYKIDDPNISNDELESKIQDTRKRWNASINGANERNASRDKTRLENADKYESILRDSKLRKEVINFYSKSKGSSSSNSTTTLGSIDFAREYFELFATTKKIKKSDVDFFFEYYRAERKNKKAIYEMLTKEMKVIGLGKEKEDTDNKEDEIKEGKKKDESSPLISNLFQESTVKHIKRAIDSYDIALKSEYICSRFPSIRESLYSFIEVDSVENAQEFTDLISAKAKEMYAVRQERGVEYVPLVDLFNELQSISDNQDVVDNIKEVKLLLKYPTLTPYMYAFVDMKPQTMKGMLNVANRDYSFRDETDFILNYYNPIHDNFGIINDGVSSIIRKAEKNAKKNETLNKIDEKLGRNKNKRKIPIWAEIVHWLVYWPIFVVYLVFEVSKAIFTELHKLAIPVFVVLFIISNWLFPSLLGIDNLLILRKIFSKSEWLIVLDTYIGYIDSMNWFQTILLSLIIIIFLLAIYVLPALFVGFFVAEFTDDFSKRFDWVGLERTFQSIFTTLKMKTENQFLKQKKLFVKGKISKIFFNIICLLILITIVHFVPIGLKFLGEKTGYGSMVENTFDDDSEQKENDNAEDYSIGSVMVITESSANIRSGPGTDYEIIATASAGDTFVATGNQETASNGRIWYEIYLDSEMTQTGWASEKIIDSQ